MVVCRAPYRNTPPISLPSLAQKLVGCNPPIPTPHPDFACIVIFSLEKVISFFSFSSLLLRPFIFLVFEGLHHAHSFQGFA